MRILHFGDIHFWQLGLDADFYYPKRVLGTANLWLRRRHRFPPQLARDAAAAVLAEAADAVIFSGDMSTMSREQEFAEAARAFAPMVEKWGERFFAIPGNHDRYTPRSVRLGGYERHFPYAAFGAGERVRTADLGGLRVVGFDASRPYRVRSNGLLDQALEDELDGVLAAGGTQVLVGHFPFAYPGGAEGKWDHKLLGDERLAALVGRHRPPLYLHGHKHHRWALRDPRAPETLCVNCGPAGMASPDPAKHAGWVLIEVGADGTPAALTACHLGAGGEVLRAPLAIPERSSNP